MTWNYRVIKTKTPYGDTYAVHEVYYELGEGMVWTVDPITISGDSIDDIKWELQTILEDIEKHSVLNLEDLEAGINE